MCGYPPRVRTRVYAELGGVNATSSQSPMSHPYPPHVKTRADRCREAQAIHPPLPFLGRSSDGNLGTRPGKWMMQHKNVSPTATSPNTRGSSVSLCGGAHL